jgi:hypothetical protein
MQTLLSYFGIGGCIALILGIVIEIVPVKIYPFRWLGNAFNRDLLNSIGEIKKDVKQVESKLDDHIVKSYRNNILNFQEKLLVYPERKHTRETWNQIINECSEYEKYINENHLTNGTVSEAILFIRHSYQKALTEINFSDLTIK